MSRQPDLKDLRGQVKKQRKSDEAMEFWYGVVGLLIILSVLNALGVFGN